MNRRQIIERVTDWRYLMALAVLVVGVALVLFGYGSLRTASASKAQTRAVQSQLATSNDQVKVLRQQRDQANTRADTATARADEITNVALARIQDITCATYQGLGVTAAFAGLVYNSKTATPAQKASVAPFVRAPSKPAGC
jgi:Sec-independent protein translocase protein TatA